jgi:hypothetical protein
LPFVSWAIDMGFVKVRVAFAFSGTPVVAITVPVKST